MNRCFIAALTLCTMSMFGCKEDFKDPTIWDLRPCDPSRPIEFTDFIPKGIGLAHLNCIMTKIPSSILLRGMRPKKESKEMMNGKVCVHIMC